MVVLEVMMIFADCDYTARILHLFFFFLADKHTRKIITISFTFKKKTGRVDECMFVVFTLDFLCIHPAFYYADNQDKIVMSILLCDDSDGDTDNI